MNSRAGSTDTSLICTPSGRSATAGARRGVLHMHGSGGTGLQVLDPSVGYQPLAAKLTDHGGCILWSGAFGGGNTWGNDTFLSACDADWAALKSSSEGAAKTDKVVIVGGSMGGLNAVNWAYRNPTLVAALVLIIPVLNLQSAYVDNRGGLQANIQLGWGGGAPTYSTRDPLVLASGLAGIPTKVWYASDDPYTFSADYSTFAASVGSSCTLRNMGAVGHTYSAADVNEVLAFVAAYL